MTAKRWQLIEELFHQALEIAPDAREEFLRSRSDLNPELTTEIRALLQFHHDDPLNDHSGRKDSQSHKQLQEAVEAAAELLRESSIASSSKSTQPDQGGNSATRANRRSANPTEVLRNAKQTLGPLSDRFELQELIGYGGSGCVIRAWDKALQRTIAIKVLHSNGQDNPSQDSNSTQHFLLDESRNLAGVQSDHIVQVYEVGTVGDSSFILMEYVKGVSLRQFLQDTPELPPRLAAEITRQIASGLADAHARDLVHRDVKPSNILITRNSDDGYRVKIVDFGLARPCTISTAQSVHHRVEGTPAYMPPEILEGSPLAQPQSDVYALGVTSYQLLTKVAPFRGALHMLLVQKRQPVTSPRSLDDRIPIDLESVCLKAMAEDPDVRYSDARALKEDLERFLAGHATLARPLSKWQTSWRWLKRHPELSAAVVLLFLFLGTLSIGSSFYASLLWSKNQAIERERQQTQIALESQILTGEPESLLLAVQQFERMAISPLKQLRALASQVNSPRGELNVSCALAILGEPTQEQIIALVPSASRSRAQCQVIAHALKAAPSESLQQLKREFPKSETSASAQLENIQLATFAWFLGDDSLLASLLEKPGLRTEFIHGLPTWCPDLEAAIAQCRKTTAPELSTAFLLGLGWMDEREFSAAQLAELRELCLQLDVQHDVAPSLAAAARWFSKRKNWPTQFSESGLPFHMVPIAEGTFLMGSGNDALLYAGRKQQRVKITRPFMMADREVSVELFRSVLSKSKTAEQLASPLDWSPDEVISPTDRHPAQKVTWFEAIRFCNALSAQFGFEPCYIRVEDIELPPEGEADSDPIKLPHWTCDLTANGFRLPTEAEWEYAARAGTQTDYSFGDDRHFLEYYGSWSNNTRVPCEPCATLMPNPWGLFDMHGNVWEWTQDWFMDSPETERTDPCNEVPSIEGRSFRGGGVATFSGDPLSNSRGRTLPEDRYFNLGFRVARTITD